LFFYSNRQLNTGFIFQKDGAPAHMACSAQLQANCPDFITKDQWFPNSPNINPMDYHVSCAMLEAYCKLKTYQKQSLTSRKRFKLSGATCRKNRSTRLWKTYET